VAISERLKIVFKNWKYKCACGSGYCEPADCSGPPTKKQIEEVETWMQNQEQTIDIFPFNDPDLWDWLEL